jgi:Ca2+-binding RTX toxin-like protein
VSVYGGAGNDRICGDPAIVDGGDGDDLIYTVGGSVVGGAGNDAVSHAGGTTDGGPGNDRLRQRQFGTARGGEGNDVVTAAIFVGVADPTLPPWETAAPAGEPVFDLVGDAGADRLMVGAPTDGTTRRRCPACDFSVDGGDGRDAVGVRGLGARIHLKQGTARFAGTEAHARDVEGAIGSAGPDVIVGDAGRNTLSGKGGRDRIYGGPGGDLLKGGAAHDLLVGQRGLDGALGGSGVDTCRAELAQNC